MLQVLDGAASVAAMSDQVVSQKPFDTDTTSAILCSCEQDKHVECANCAGSETIDVACIIIALQSRG